jgi:hypothetical protein
MFTLSLESWTPSDATIRIQQQDSLKLYHGCMTCDKRDIAAVQRMEVHVINKVICKKDEQST